MGDVESALRELRINYRLSGDEAVAKCPSGNHADNHPSWSCNTRTGIHHCFSCGFSGNLSHLVATLLNLSYPEAVLWCNSKVGWSRAHQWREDYQNTNYAPPSFKISEADLALFVTPPDEKLAEKKINLYSAQKFEVLWDENKSEWIFPIRHPYSFELWGWQAKGDTVFRNYPAGIKRSETLFGLPSFYHGSTAILVESPIDCARLLTAKQSGGLSGFGVSVSDKQLSLIHGLTEHLILCFDNDSAGVDQTARVSRSFNQVRQISIFNYGMSDAKDVGEMTDEEIKFGIDNALPRLSFDGIYRDIGRLPDSTRAKVFRPWQLISSIYNGAWENSYRNSIGRRIICTTIN